MAGDLLVGREVLDERFKAFVLGDNVEGGAGGLGGDFSNVVSDVEIQGVPACALDADVLGIRPEALELVGEIEGDLALVGTAKDLYLELLALKAGQVLRLNVLKVNKDDVRFHGAHVYRVCDGTAVDLE